MKAERGTEAKDAGALSRRRLLRLTAYTVPMLAVLDVAGAARVMAQSGQVKWYRDDDGDGFGRCDDWMWGPADGPPPDLQHRAKVCGDCDDWNPTVHPAMPELPGDGLDNNCDGTAL